MSLLHKLVTELQLLSKLENNHHFCTVLEKFVIAIEDIKAAEIEVRVEHHRPALHLYKQSILSLIHILREKILPENLAQKLRKICSNLLARAEHIKAVIMEQTRVPQVTASNSPRPTYDSSYFKRLAIKMEEDIAGCEEAKTSIKECILLPLMFPHLFAGVRRSKKLFFIFGPPGVGKTYFCRAVCNMVSEDAKGTCFWLNMSDICSKYREDGESRQIRQVFNALRENKPSLIVVDEMERLDSAPESYILRVKTELLVQIDNMGANTWAILVSQTPWTLSSSFRRRVDRHIPLDFPDHQARLQIFSSAFRDNVLHTLTDLHFEELALRSKGLTQSDIGMLCKEAIFTPIRKYCKVTESKKTKVEATAGQQEAAAGQLEAAAGQQEAAAGQQEAAAPIDLDPVLMEDCLNCLSRASPTVLNETRQKFNNFIEDYIGDNKMYEYGKKNSKPLEVLCSETIASHICQRQSPNSIRMVTELDLPLPKKLLLMVQKHYSEKLPFELILQ